MYEALTDFIDIKREPHRRLVNQMNNLKHIPDRLYVILKENFGYSGQMTRKTREFEKPKFRQQTNETRPNFRYGKRHKPKGRINPNSSGKDRTAINAVW